jgi:prepilin-type N-terminal cleavage/methylation domain-containing protein
VPERLRRRRLPATVPAAGFSLLEVVVAILILGITMAGIGPSVVASVQASSTAKLASQSKGLLQGQLDAMRTLPFRVTPSAGDYRDLLDTYYRNLTGPTVTPVCGTTALNAPLAGWSGYVPATSAARCSYEPAGVPMYRKVLPPGTGGIPRSFALVVDTTFVAATTVPTVLTPPTGYNSQTAGKDRPPSSQVGVTATVMRSDHGRWVPLTVYTQISSRTPSDTRLKLDARATAIEIGTSRPSGESISMAGGQLELNGSVSTVSQARASLAAITASSSLSGRKDGAALTVAAPYTNLAQLDAAVGGLESGCSAPCWGVNAVTPFTVAADNGLPRAGTGLLGLINPVQTVLTNQLNDGFRFATGSSTLPGVSGPIVSMDPVPTVGSVLTNAVNGLYNCAFSLTGPASNLTGSGYINSTDDTATSNPLSAEACGGGHTDVVRIMPTATAPDGLIRITARSAARCRVTGAAHVPATDVRYLAEVEYWKWTPAVLNLLGIVILPGHGQYVSAGVITPTTTTDPLASIPMTTPVSDGRVLSDYIESISGLTKDQVTTSAVATDHVAQVTIPALVTVLTQPTVSGADNLDTAVSVAVGAASCRAEDNR